MPSFKLEPRIDLGIRRLIPEWKALLSPRDLRADIVAGLTVACIAIPLSLAIALASGVAPAVGLVTAIVAGIVCALFGGTPLQVSGPAAAMAVLVASIAQEQGLAALLVVTLGCGLLQLAVGALGLGRFIRLVPVPVIEGFTAGIGAIILIGQLPRALGLPPPPQSHVIDVVTHIKDLLHDTRPAAVGITLLTLAVLYGLPRVTRRLPPHLVAVAVATVAVAVFGIEAQTIGEIPRSLPAPSVPPVPKDLSWGGLAASTLVVFALASLETLLSASAVDKLAGGKRSDPDQELVGQGLGNMASALFGGIPVTGVIARSGVNVEAGGKTRRSSIIHALALLAAVFAFAPFIARIPIAALAAILFSVAFRMLSPRSFKALWKHARSDALVYAITFVAIVFLDLLEGIQWGVVAALAIAAIKLGRTRMIVRGAKTKESYLFALEGPLTFMSSLDIENLRREIDVLEPGRTVVFDVSGVAMTDASGSEMLASVMQHAEERGLRPFFVGFSDGQREQLVALIGEQKAREVIAVDHADLAQKVGERSADQRLRAGVARYRAKQKPRYSGLFERLADNQAPHTLFITCSDSRISPNLITGTEPGELFIVRDVGNLVPPGDAVQASAVSAAIDYAVGVLGVRKIVVCGHSQCGAMKALRGGGAIPKELRNLEAWVEKTEVRHLLQNLPSSLDLDQVGRLNALAQLDHLKTYPIVADKLGAGELSLDAWFFDVGAGEIEEWSVDQQRFVRIADSEEVQAAPAPPRPALSRAR